ncbi:MAG: transcriptional modulator of MazE/toxin, MazF [Dehalococcoidia bacterium]|nr:transcriptional modulator of MazE/toxin, MazF [Dehalococcoidia bacterium]
MVVSNEDFNQLMPVVTVLPLTSLKSGRKIYPGEVLLRKGEANLGVDSLVLAHQIRTISKRRLRKDIGSLDAPGSQRQIENAVKLHLDLP